MTKEQIQAAIEHGPITLLMADGKQYYVPHPDYLWFPPKSTSVTVGNDNGWFFILPLRTITGLQYTGEVEEKQ